MTKRMKITRDEVIKILEDSYNLKNIRFMKSVSYESDSPVSDEFEYIEGDLIEKHKGGKEKNESKNRTAKNDR